MVRLAVGDIIMALAHAGRRHDAPGQQFTLFGVVADVGHDLHVPVPTDDDYRPAATGAMI